MKWNCGELRMLGGARRMGVRIGGIALCVLGAMGAARGADGGTVGSSGGAPEKKAKPYLLDFCLVTEEKFAASEMKPYTAVYDGQTIKFCCKACVRDFEKAKKKYVAQMEAAVKKLPKK